jgi:NAD(P)-dependent dehydrogenase (short-subunit alcohol dehydrogenase family)
MPLDDILTDPAAKGFTGQDHHDTYPFISPSKLSLEGKYYLISGASKGIGKAICVSLASAGASGIACLARTSVAETAKAALAAAKKAGRKEPKILQIKCDMTVPSDVDAAAKQIEAEFGRLDVLVNNAGAIGPWVPMADSKIDEWWQTWEVNVKGVYLMDRVFIPILLNSEGGLKTIVTCTSAGGLVNT